MDSKITARFKMLLLQLCKHFQEWASFPIATFAPVIEHQHPGAFLVQRPEETYRQNQAARVPLITGYTRYEMSWLFAEFLRNKTAVSELNSDWDRLGEIFLTIRNATGSNSTIATRIRDFYLGEDTEISFRNRDHIVMMLGGRYFLPCALDAIVDHSRYTGEPVYAYEFSYEGKHSVVEGAGQNASDWGVAHIDDLIYLLNSTEYYATINADDAEFSMSNILTGIWYNFAQYGKPYISQGGQLTDLWQPITRNTNSLSSLQFLDLNLTPSMIDNPYTERYNFWKSLQLTD
ncbi:unnamed protein product [Orchesella dallaii]|uniref:Carboxylesterase type B domain-containing protein n=1 Tax=Orchesella dallaii TaxID=48710 RepID=A0ABP1QKU6_9HEXA